MVKRNRKISASLLLGVVSLQMVLPFLLACSILLITVFQNNRINNEHNPALFEHIRVSEKDQSISFINKKEFRYKGVLYDIKSIRKDNGNYEILALSDKRETSLEKVAAGQHEGKQKQASASTKSLPFVFLFFEKISGPFFSMLYTGEHTISYNNNYLSTAYTSIITPPPQQACLSMIS